MSAQSWSRPMVTTLTAWVLMSSLVVLGGCGHGSASLLEDDAAEVSDDSLGRGAPRPVTGSAPSATQKPGDLPVTRETATEPKGAKTLGAAPCAGNACDVFGGDFDGDGREDVAAYWHPTDGSQLSYWHIFYTSQPQQAPVSVQFGIGRMKPVPGDYDGDGKTDLAVYDQINPEATWYISQSKDGFVTKGFGWADAEPVPADYDGDGKTDVAVHYRETGMWYVQGSRAGFSQTEFGYAATMPVPGDYDGDSLADIAVFRQSDARWYIARTALGFLEQQFGWAATPAAHADFDGDGSIDIAVQHDYSPAAYVGGTPRPVVASTYVIWEQDKAALAKTATSTTINQEKQAAFAAYRTTFAAAEFRARTITSALAMRHIDEFPGATDTAKLVAAATFIRSTPGTALVIGGRSYTLTKIIDFEYAQDLLIIGVDGAEIDSQESVHDSGTTYSSDPSEDGSAFVFAGPSHVTIANLSFRGRELRRFPAQTVRVDITGDGVGDWDYTVPPSDTNFVHGRAIYAVDPSELVIVGSTFRHFNGAGVHTQSNSAATSIRVRDNRFFDCMNFFEPMSFYVNVDFDESTDVFFATYDDSVRFDTEMAAVHVNGNVYPTVADIFIENNLIVGPLMDGIFVNGVGMNNVSITGNTVRGYNLAFSQRGSAGEERAFNRASEMGIHVQISESNGLRVAGNHVAGFMCEDIVLAHLDDVLVSPAANKNITIENNDLIDSGFRGIAIYGPTDGRISFDTVSISGNQVIGLRTALPSTPIGVTGATRLSQSSNTCASSFAADGPIQWQPCSAK